MPKARPRLTSEQCKAAELRKVWYEFSAGGGETVRFATWNDALSDYTVDFAALWNEVVQKEVFARTAWNSWRRAPCKRIGTVLPAGFLSWSEFLARGGIHDPTTGAGSLSAAERAHFWNDQCTCSPPCWSFPVLEEPSDVNPKRRRLACACGETPCACDTVVTRSKEDEVAELKRMVKLFPFAKTLNSRIADLESGKAQPHSTTYGALLRADKALVEASVKLRLKAAEAEELPRKCSSFWWILENDFVRDTRRSPKSAVEMLRWFWSGREEFVAAFRKRVGKEALSYL